MDRIMYEYILLIVYIVLYTFSQYYCASKIYKFPTFTELPRVNLPKYDISYKLINNYYFYIITTDIQSF